MLTMGGASGDSSVSIVTRLCVGCARNSGSISGTGKVSIPKLRIGLGLPGLLFSGYLGHVSQGKAAGARRSPLSLRLVRGLRISYSPMRFRGVYSFRSELCFYFFPRKGGIKCRNSPRNRKLLQVTLPRGSDSYLSHTEMSKDEIGYAFRTHGRDFRA